MRRSLVILATLVVATALAQPAAAANSPGASASVIHPGPPKAPASVIATELTLTHSGYGTLVFQPQIDAGAQATSFSAHADRSPATNGVGHWLVPATTVDTAHGITCRGTDPSGDLDITCQATAGADLPTGRYLVQVPVRRIGGLNSEHDLSISCVAVPYCAGAPVQIVDSSTAPTSTGIVRQVHVDDATGLGDIALNLQITPGDEVDSVEIAMSGPGRWKYDPSHPGNRNGLSCVLRADGLRGQDLGFNFRCTGPDGRLPAGTRSVVLPVHRTGPALTQNYPPYAPVFEDGWVVLSGPRYDNVNSVVDIFPVS